VSIITITAGSCSKGEQIAKSVAKRIEYDFIDLETILSLASKEFGVPESKLVKALKDTPSTVGLFSQTKQQHIIYIDTVLAEYMLKNNIVYYGAAGLPFIQGISHVLKVQIIANLEDRINNKAKLDSVPQEKARKTVIKEDNQQKKWAGAVYNINLTDPNLYDLVINIGHIKDDDVEDALGTIISTVKHNKFQPMTYSLRCANNVAMSCRVRATLSDIDPKMLVKSDEGTVYIYTKSIKRKAKNKVLEMKQKVMKIEGVNHVEVYVNYDLFSTVAHGQ